MIDYTIFYKRELPVNEPWPKEEAWDVFISAYVPGNRTKRAYEQANATHKKEHFLVSGAGDEVGMNRKASIRAGDQKMVWTEPQALPWLWALHGRPRICWAVRPAHEGGIGGY